jgi:hypothetical protein
MRHAITIILLPLVMGFFGSCRGVDPVPDRPGEAERVWRDAERERLQRIADPVATAKEANFRNPDQSPHVRAVHEELGIALEFLPAGKINETRLSLALDPATADGPELVALYAQAKRDAQTLLRDIAAKEAAWESERAAIRREYEDRMKRAERDAARNKLHLVGGILMLGVAVLGVAGFLMRMPQLFGAAALAGLAGSLCFGLARFLDHAMFPWIFGGFSVLVLISILVAGWLWFRSWWEVNHALERTVENIELAKRSTWNNRECEEFEEIARKNTLDVDKRTIDRVKARIHPRYRGSKSKQERPAQNA